MLENVLKYFSLVSIGAFTISYAYLSSYYGFFNINIVNYINTSEIFYKLLPLAIIAMSLGYYVFVVEVMKTKQNVTNIESHGNGVKWLAALGFVVALSGFIVSNIYSPYFSAATVSVICQALAIFSVTYTQLRKRIQQEGLSMPLLIVIYLFIGFLSIHYGRESAAITKQIGSPKKILFKHNNVLYRSNDTMIFLGETQSTLFVYHKNNSTTWILPRNDVDSMVILEK